MSDTPLDVGFIVHDAGRTGAPIVLLRIIRELVRDGVARPRFVIRRSGNLLEEFRALGPVLVVGQRERLDGGAGALAREHDALRATVTRFRLARFLAGVDVLYSNTIVNGDVVELIGMDRVPLVTHVHELARFLPMWTSARLLAATVERTSAWIAVSTPVLDMLVSEWRIPRERIAIIHGCVDAAVLDHADNRAEGNRILGVDDAAWVIGCVGSIDHHKGADLAPVLARFMLNSDTDRPLAFRWLGGARRTPEHDAAEQEAARAGLADQLRFLGDIPQPMDAIGRFDVHVLLSREDSYPLVMIEAAARGRPTVCFADSGGAPEFIARGGGRVVPYLDIRAMSRAILELLMDSDPDRGLRLRALAAEHGAEPAARRVAEILRGAVGG